MKKILRLILRPGSLWSAVAYLSGIRTSRLFTVNARINAPYRAVVLGLDEGYWAHFDEAYPEFQKLFARDDVLASELRLAFMHDDTAAIVFTKANRRKLSAAIEETDTVVFEGTAAPVPILARDGKHAYGFTLDSAGRWLVPRRPTEFSMVLENFNFGDREAFIEDAERILEALKIEPAPVEKCLVIVHNDDAEDARQQINQEMIETADAAGSGHPHALFNNLNEDWWAPEVQEAFIRSLQDCTTVVTHSSPLGIIALLAGRRVMVTGRPVWAGFGLEHSKFGYYRPRSLAMSEFAALIMFVLSRYVDDDGNLIDPIDGWRLPVTSTATGKIFATGK